MNTINATMDESQYSYFFSYASRLFLAASMCHSYITTNELNVENLNKFDAIILGIRAFNTVEDLKFYNSDLQFVAEPGQFDIFVGGNSAADKKVSFELTK